MKAGIIGAGRVGGSLTIALLKKGMKIEGIFSRNAEAARIIMEGLQCTVFDDICDLVECCDTIFITVPDTSISAVAEQILKTCGRNSIAGKRFLHCSGALTSGELHVLNEAGGFAGSLHPIQTFPEKMNSWASMYDISFGFEGSAEAEAAAAEIVLLLGGKMLRISAEGKMLYHAAACVLSNYTVTLAQLASKLLEHAGLECGELEHAGLEHAGTERDGFKQTGKGEKVGIKSFMPLLRSTVDNIERLGSVEALTGPISRGDVGTVASHMDAMERVFPREKELYGSLGRETVFMSLAKGTIDEAQAKKMIQILGGIE